MNFSMKPLGEICTARSGNSTLIKGRLFSENNGARFPAFSATGQDVFADQFEHEGAAVVVSAVGARCGKCFLASDRWAAIANTHILFPRPDLINCKYLWYLVNDEKFWERGGTALPFVKIQASLKKMVLVPTMSDQRRIVAILDAADELRRLCAEADRRTVDLIPALFHEMIGDPVGNPRGWPLNPLGELADNQDGKRRPVKSSDRDGMNGPYPYYGASGIIDYTELVNAPETGAVRN